MSRLTDIELGIMIGVQLAGNNGVRTIQTLSLTQGKKDDVLFRLTNFVLPWLGDGMRMSDLMFDYFVLMFCSHMASAYGSVRFLPAVQVGGLVPWQMKRLTELIEDRLDGELRLSVLAGECGLSTSHFSRSFKRSFGVPVHRYVMQRRVERAKSLMKNSVMSLTEIALQSGFSDQASFSRTFGGMIGAPPRRWLNEYRHSSQPEGESDGSTRLDR